MAVVFIPREIAAGERRVAATPESVKRLVSAGLEVHIEKGAGSEASITDDAYRDVDATIVDDAADGWGQADVVATVSAPSADAAGNLREGAILVGLLAPNRNLDLVRRCKERGATSFALELVPRVSRAQSMDALSSQAGLAGYRSVIMAAYHLDKHFPLSMTAAGTLRPATVIVLGAGVAGLQAIATAKRLGAVVRANDIREAAKEEVESIGGEFIDLEAEADAEAEGGYAKEVDEDFLTMQRRILGKHLAEAHAVITTAFVPGRPAPKLVTEEMVDGMRPGSVIIDLAAPTGGNCVLTPEEGEVEHGGVRIIAAGDLPSQLPGEASLLYGRNIAEFVKLLVDDESGEIRVDREDEIIDTSLVTIGGEVVHEPTAEALADDEGSST
jgi:H+-translocating NAD(P) transhydrogenase subunit alpha